MDKPNMWEDYSNVTGKRSLTFLLPDDLKNSLYSKLIWPFGRRNTAGKKSLWRCKDIYPRQRPMTLFVKLEESIRKWQKGIEKQVTPWGNSTSWCRAAWAVSYLSWWAHSGDCWRTWVPRYRWVYSELRWQQLLTQPGSVTALHSVLQNSEQCTEFLR